MVKIGNTCSESTTVDSGFPQGSVLGGLKYTMYTTPLDKLIVAHLVNHEDYADDTNLYMSFNLRSPADTAETVTRMENCLTDVETWMLRNRLKLNRKKTEVVVFVPPRQKSIDFLPTSVKVANLQIPVATHFKSLGVILDKHMTMTKQVNSTSKSAFFHLRKISKARNYFDREITKTLVSSLVTSRLDYCNSLLCLLPKRTTRKLQCAQNAAAKTIFLAGRRTHVTPLLKQLHWLPVIYRSMFKVLVLTYKAVSGMAPEYLTDLITEYQPTRNLRSSNERLLVHPRIQRNNYGCRAFCNVSPSMWNKLPAAVRKVETLAEFKSKLKSHFFIEHFGSHLNN